MRPPRKGIKGPPQEATAKVAAIAITSEPVSQRPNRCINTRGLNDIGMERTRDIFVRERLEISQTDIHPMSNVLTTEIHKPNFSRTSHTHSPPLCPVQRQSMHPAPQSQLRHYASQNRGTQASTTPPRSTRQYPTSSCMDVVMKPCSNHHISSLHTETSPKHRIAVKATGNLQNIVSAMRLLRIGWRR